MFEQTLTPREFGERAGIAYTTVLFHMKRGLIDAYQYAGEYYIHEDQVDKFIRIKQLGLTVLGGIEYMTCSKLAEYLGMSYHNTLKMIKDQRIPHRKVLSIRYITLETAQDLAEELEREPEDDELSEFLDTL